MERRFVVCCVTSFFGLLSVAMGFAAEALRIKATEAEFPPPSGCIDRRSPAHILAAASITSLFLSKSLIDVATLCPYRRPGSIGISICSIVSSSTYITASFLFVSGASTYNLRHLMDEDYFVVKPGAFAGGAVMSLATVITSIIAYLFSGPIGLPASPSQGSIAMGQPQIHPEPHDPDVVPEDTPL